MKHSSTTATRVSVHDFEPLPYSYFVHRRRSSSSITSFPPRTNEEEPKTKRNRRSGRLRSARLLPAGHRRHNRKFVATSTAASAADAGPNQYTLPLSAYCTATATAEVLTSGPQRPDKHGGSEVNRLFEQFRKPMSVAQGHSAGLNPDSWGRTGEPKRCSCPTVGSQGPEAIKVGEMTKSLACLVAAHIHEVHSCEIRQRRWHRPRQLVAGKVPARARQGGYMIRSPGH